MLNEPHESFLVMFFPLTFKFSSVQEALINQLCVVVSQELCSERIEAKLIPQSIPFKYVFLSMVI